MQPGGLRAKGRDVERMCQRGPWLCAWWEPSMSAWRSQGQHCWKSSFTPTQPVPGICFEHHCTVMAEFLLRSTRQWSRQGSTNGKFPLQKMHASWLCGDPPCVSLCGEELREASV